jgi:hypothetical protein
VAIIPQNDVGFEPSVYCKRVVLQNSREKGSVGCSCPYVQQKVHNS